MTIAIFLLPNRIFAWFEYVTSLIKIVIFLIIITLSLALILGAGPKGFIHHGGTWTEFNPFLNGFAVRLNPHHLERLMLIASGIFNMRLACYMGGR